MSTEYVYWLPGENGSHVDYKTISNSIILIGANGSGKSRLGAWIEQQSTDQVHRIGAQRNLNFVDNIPMKSYHEAEEMVLYNNAELEGRKEKIFKFGSPEEDKYITHLFDDFDSVLSALIAMSNNENLDFIKACKDAEEKGESHPHTPVTEIDKLFTIWNDIFPQRYLKYDDLRFYAVDPQDDNRLEYSATKMSDGERAALYFIAQVLCVPARKILLIDEPELHLHRSLINRLWLALEKYRPDCLFIYITHDTQFASLHHNSDKYWVKNYSGNDCWEIERIESQELPEELLLDLLGNRKNVLFVEGTTGSYDTQLYSLIYKDYYVIPCGSCTQVIIRTKAFNNTELLHHYKAYGLIDRDYRPDYEIEALKSNNIFTIEVAEVENLFITEELIRSIAKNLGENEDEIFHKIKTYIVEERFKKQVDSQVCQAVVAEIKYQLSAIEIDKKNEAHVKETLAQGLNRIDYDTIKQAIETRFKEAVDNADYYQVLRLFNEKGLSKSIGQFMGIINKYYCQMAIGMMKNGTIDADRLMGRYLPGLDVIPR